MIRNNQKTGFTLLEILVAMAIITAVICMVYGSYYVLSDSAKRCQTRISTNSQNRILLEGLSRQIRCSYLPPDINETKTYDQAAPTDRNKTLFYGNAADTTGNILRFVTTARLLSKNSSNAGLYDIAYRFDKTKHTLYLSQKKYIGTTNTDSTSRKYLPIAENIDSVELRFYDGSQWLDKWDLNKKKYLPAAVEIKLSCSGNDGSSYYYNNAVNLYCGSKTKNKQETVFALAY